MFLVEYHKTQSKDERSGFNCDACSNSDKGEFIFFYVKVTNSGGGGGGGGGLGGRNGNF